MNLTARAKLLLIVSGFLLPIAASVATYVFFRPQATGNYGEWGTAVAATSSARADHNGIGRYPLYFDANPPLNNESTAARSYSPQIEYPASVGWV